MFIISQGLGSENECAYQVTSHRLLASNRLIELLAETQQRLCERRMWRRRSVGEVSEACHNKRIRQELSVPSADTSYDHSKFVYEREGTVPEASTRVCKPAVSKR